MNLVKIKIVIKVIVRLECVDSVERGWTSSHIIFRRINVLYVNIPVIIVPSSQLSLPLLLLERPQILLFLTIHK